MRSTFDRYHQEQGNLPNGIYQYGIAKDEEEEVKDYLSPKDNNEEVVNKLRKSSYKGSTDSFELLDMIASQNSKDEKARKRSELEDYIQDSDAPERTSLGKGYKGLLKKST